MDHRYLNNEVPPFDTDCPNGGEHGRGDLAAAASRGCRWQRASCRRCGLYETEDLYVDYAGE